MLGVQEHLMTPLDALKRVLRLQWYDFLDQGLLLPDASRRRQNKRVESQSRGLLGRWIRMFASELG